MGLQPTFSGLAKVANFTTNVDAENQTLINQKCVCGALNRHFCQTRVIASGICPLCLQTIVVVELSCHLVSAVGCFFYFFRSVGNLLKTIFLWVGFTSSIKNFGRALTCAVFNCACKMRWLYFLSDIVFQN